MSIDRSPSSANATAPREVNQDASEARPREPAPRDKVDDFQRVLQGKRDSREGRLQPASEEGGEPTQQAGRREGHEASEWKQDNGAIAGRQDAADHYEDDALRRQRDDAGGSTLQQTLDPAALYQAQMAMREGLPQATAPTPLNPNAFADMVERHLKQMAADRGAAGGDEGRVLLRMADATLPGTDLLLSRTPEGWLLRADVRSRSSFDAIREAAPELARRFADRNLGTLSIDPHFHG